MFQDSEREPQRVPEKLGPLTSNEIVPSVALREISGKFEDNKEHLPNVVVAAELIMNVVEACALSDRPLKLDELKEYTGKNPRSVNEAVKAGLWLGLLDSVTGGFTTSHAIRSRFRSGKEPKAILFLEYLQRKKSFIQFAAFLDCNEDSKSASEKVRVLYQIDVPALTVLDLFGGWGRTAGLFEGANRTLRLKPEFHAPNLPTEYLKELKEALESDMRARVFIDKKLTKETFQLIPPSAIDRAVKAIRGIRVDPRNSVEDAGEVLEDYLRIKAHEAGINVTGATGIGGVIKSLGPRITDEHRIVGDALNTLRVMSAHPTRATTERRWEISPDSGLEAVLLSLSLMRSIDEYTRRGTTVF